MLRITGYESPTEFRFYLEGRLAGLWVRELAICWQTAQSSIGDRTLSIDLRSVDFVDAAGEQLLAAMHRSGAKLIAASLMTKYVVSEITGEPEDTSGVLR